MRLRTAVIACCVTGLITLAAPLSASAAIHVVAPGETLTSVAGTDGLTVQALATANGISETAELTIGQILRIPPLTSLTAAKPLLSAPTSSSGASSTTSSSETSSTSDAATTQTSGTTETSTSTTTTSATGTQTSTSSTPEPTDENVSAAEIAEIADSEGVSPALAEGIAWQESGWSNAVVSNVGAVGVMQIVPDTWGWINTYLTPADPLQPASAAANVRGGVLLLHDLLVLTGGDETMAVAAYYQGLASVRAHGMYADTKQYVADVLALAARF